MDIVNVYLSQASAILESLPKRISCSEFPEIYWELRIYVDGETKDLAIAYIKVPGKPTNLDTPATLLPTLLDKTCEINVHFCELGTLFQEMKASFFINCITLFSRRIKQAKELNQITVLF